MPLPNAALQGGGGRLPVCKYVQILVYQVTGFCGQRMDGARKEFSSNSFDMCAKRRVPEGYEADEI